MSRRRVSNADAGRLDTAQGLLELFLTPDTGDEPETPQRALNRVCAWVGGERPNWVYCEAPAEGPTYCPEHEALCRGDPLPKDLDRWVEAQIPKEPKAKKIKFAKSGWVW